MVAKRLSTPPTPSTSRFTDVEIKQAIRSINPSYSEAAIISTQEDVYNEEMVYNYRLSPREKIKRILEKLDDSLTPERLAGMTQQVIDSVNYGSQRGGIWRGSNTKIVSCCSLLFCCLHRQFSLFHQPPQ